MYIINYNSIEPFTDRHSPHCGACHYLCAMRGTNQHGYGQEQPA